MNYQEFSERWEEDGIKDWPLIAVIEKHTGAKGVEAAWWASRLHVHGIINGYRTYSRSKDIEALHKLDRAIGDVQRLLNDGSMTSLAAERFFMEVYFAQESEELSECLEEKMASQTVLEFPIIADILKFAIYRTISEIETSTLTKSSSSKLNEDGISIVDASRFIWRLATGVNAPLKDLNVASKFGNFLADVFETCDIKGDPRSAFRAWARERGEWSLDQPN